jgi:hypothetical protein
MLKALLLPGLALALCCCGSAVSASLGLALAEGGTPSLAAVRPAVLFGVFAGLLGAVPTALTAVLFRREEAVVFVGVGGALTSLFCGLAWFFLTLARA